MTATYLGSPLQRLAHFVSSKDKCLKNNYDKFVTLYRNETWNQSDISKRSKNSFSRSNYLLFIILFFFFLQWDSGTIRRARSTVTIKQPIQRDQFLDPCFRCHILQIFAKIYTANSTSNISNYLNICPSADKITRCVVCSYNRDFLNNRIKRTNMMYGGLRPDLRNVIFTNGDVDPWHALSVLQDLNAFSPAVLIKGNVSSIFVTFFLFKIN